ncbi:MAG: DNA-formamidopyrimidine glycosylase family protein [Longimicrobiales bacterium]
MPEGDTVHRIAGRLRADLGGQSLDRLYVQGHGEIGDLQGSAVSGIEVRGKHMLVHLDRGWSLRVHLGMKGKWAKRPSTERITVRTAARLDSGPWAFVCNNAYQTELLKTGHLKAHPRLRALGPDLLGEPPDLATMVRRAMNPAYGSREIGDLVLDQRVASGLGNVYKSEVLFLERIHPRKPVSALSESDMTQIFTRAHTLMLHNLSTRSRETVPLKRRPHPGSPRLWVYKRDGQRCLECGTTVERIRQGDQARSTYFCPGCQPSGANRP